MISYMYYFLQIVPMGLGLDGPPGLAEFLSTHPCFDRCQREIVSLGCSALSALSLWQLVDPMDEMACSRLCVAFAESKYDFMCHT